MIEKLAYELDPNYNHIEERPEEQCAHITLLN